MKKILLFLTALICCITDVYANEIIHGIDVDAVYASGDWSNKNKINDIINDYSLVLQYQERLALCSPSRDKLNCLNILAEEIIKHFYNHNLYNNLNDYYTYVKSVSAAYGIIYCLNKYRLPSGTMCNQETQVKVQENVEQYVNNLLQSVDQIFRGYSFLQDYKD